MVQWHPLEAVGLTESVPFWSEVSFIGTLRIWKKKKEQMKTMLYWRGARVMCEADLNMELSHSSPLLPFTLFGGKWAIKVTTGDELAPGCFPLACELRIFFNVIKWLKNHKEYISFWCDISRNWSYSVHNWSLLSMLSVQVASIESQPQQTVELQDLRLFLDRHLQSDPLAALLQWWRLPFKMPFYEFGHFMVNGSADLEM